MPQSPGTHRTLLHSPQLSSPNGHPAPQPAEHSQNPKALPAQSSQNSATHPEGAQPPQHPLPAAQPTALMATSTTITAALSGAFKNTPGSNLQLRAQACECPRPRRAHQPPAGSRTGCKGVPSPGASFVKPGSLRRWLLAAPGVLRVVSFTYLFSERFGELRGLYLGVQMLECSAAPRLLHPLQPHLSVNTFQIVSFKWVTSQSRHSLNYDGFGSPESSINKKEPVCSAAGDKPLSWGSSFIYSFGGGSQGWTPPPAVGLSLSPILEGAESLPQFSSGG